jgi:Flp pilus assembly protein TadD
VGLRPGRWSDRQLAEMNPLQIAVAHYQAGRLGEAEIACRQVLSADANYVEVLHLLGVITKRVGRTEEAIALIGQTVGASRLRPMLPDQFSAVEMWLAARLR